MPRLGGLHHDFMNIIEKNDTFKFVNKVMHDSGFYQADILVNGRLFKDKTFFPAHWSRNKVVNTIYEAYDNFVKSGVKAVLKGNGKYEIKSVTKDGIDIIMYVTKKGLITSAYPIIK